MYRNFPQKPYGPRAKVETVFSVVAGTLKTKAPGRRLVRQVRQALLLGLTYNLYLYRLRHRSTRRGCQQGHFNSFRIRRVEKSLHLCLAGLRIRWFDPIAEASELPKHLRSAELLRSFGDRWAPFFVTNSLVQDQPDQPTLSMGDGPNGLIVSQARDRAAIHDLEDASFGSGCGVSSLIE